jgi:hypothetical protein
MRARAGEACTVEKKGTCMRGRASSIDRYSAWPPPAARAGGQPASKLEKNARALLLHLARLAISILLWIYLPTIDQSAEATFGWI